MATELDRLINIRAAVSRAIIIGETKAQPKGVAARHVRMVALLQEALNQDDHAMAEASPSYLNPDDDPSQAS